MALPKAQSARVDLVKLTGYLLSETHPVGRSKARFFREIGFDESTAALLQSALLELARNGVVVESIASRHGMKYVVEGGIQTPLGRRVKLRTIWIVAAGEQRPRFVTAYPL